MFTSLFGDLASRRQSGLDTLPGAATLSAGPAGEESVDGVAGQAAGRAAGHTLGPALAGVVEALSQDVVIDASPAAAIRQHFAEHRADLQRASAMLTLLDPSRLCASQVVYALADAAGQPVQRLNLRERATLRTLAVIERTLVPRRQAAALRVYHADIRASAMSQGLAQQEISNALAEGSQLTAVIVGAMQPHALVALLRSLLQATRQPEWRCPQLVFILPPGAVALRQRILEQHWPPQVQTRAVAEPLACVASVWNCVLEAWEASQPPQRADAAHPSRPACAASAANAPQAPQAPHTPHAQPTSQASPASPASPASLALTASHAPPSTHAVHAAHALQAAHADAHAAAHAAHSTPLAAAAGEPTGQFTLDRRSATTPGLPAHPWQVGGDGAPRWRPGVSVPQALTRLLAPLATSEGLLACGIVDLARGDLLASQSRERPATTDLAGLALALCAARQAHQSMTGEAAAPDEILITAGPRQTLLRSLPGDGALGFVAVLDRQQTNLALLRFKLLEAERLLV